MLQPKKRSEYSNAELQQKQDQFSAPPSLTSNTKHINKILGPIFQNVRKNKIISYYQLSRLSAQAGLNNEPKNNASEMDDNVCLDKQVLEKPIVQRNQCSMMSARNEETKKQGAEEQQHCFYDVSKKNIQKMSKTFYLSRDRNNKIGTPSSSTGNQLSSNKMNNTLYSSSVKRSPVKSPTSMMDRLSKQNSKLKKHLVQSIDFEQIQKMLYKKRDWVTRYEYFYSKLQHSRLRNKNSDNLKKQQKSRHFDQITPLNLVNPEHNEISSIKHSNYQRKKPIKSSNMRTRMNQTLHTIQQKPHRQDLSSDVIHQAATISVRSVPRKKFWVRDSTNTCFVNNRNKQFNILYNQGDSNSNSKDNRLNQFISGKAYRTISHQQLSMRAQRNTDKQKYMRSRQIENIEQKAGQATQAGVGVGVVSDNTVQSDLNQQQ